MDASTALAALLPANMPHPFKAILVALAQSTMPDTNRASHLQQYRDYRPAIFPTTLQRALLGEPVPVLRLRPALKYRQVSFYRQESLALTGDEPFLRMLLALSQLFRAYGLRAGCCCSTRARPLSRCPVPARA